MGEMLKAGFLIVLSLALVISVLYGLLYVDSQQTIEELEGELQSFGTALSEAQANLELCREVKEGYKDTLNWSNSNFASCIEELQEERSPETFVASNYFKTSDISFVDGKIQLSVDDTISELVFANTLSMNPVLNYKTTGLGYKPLKESELEKNNLISFKPLDKDHYVVHRIIEVGSDEEGVYYITKGDNNPIPDFGKVRFSKVRYKVVGILY